MLLRTCRKCGKERELRYFTDGKGHATRSYTCDLCHSRNKKAPKRIKKLKEKIRQNNKRLRNYGLSAKALENLYKQQAGLCAVCGKAEKLVIDHDHRTGKVRGLLCNSCNSALGFAYDKPLLLFQLAAYLLGISTRIADVRVEYPISNGT